MAEQTIADYDNTFSLRPNRLDGCYSERVEAKPLAVAGLPSWQR
jgi:hypothetical protein